MFLLLQNKKRWNPCDIVTMVCRLLQMLMYEQSHYRPIASLVIWIDGYLLNCTIQLQTSNLLWSDMSWMELQTLVWILQKNLPTDILEDREEHFGHQVWMPINCQRTILSLMSWTIMSNLLLHLRHLYLNISGKTYTKSKNDLHQCICNICLYHASTMWIKTSYMKLIQ